MLKSHGTQEYKPSLAIRARWARSIPWAPYTKTGAPEIETRSPGRCESSLWEILVLWSTAEGTARTASASRVSRKDYSQPLDVCLIRSLCPGCSCEDKLLVLLPRKMTPGCFLLLIPGRGSHLTISPLVTVPWDPAGQEMDVSPGNSCKNWGTRHTWNSPPERNTETENEDGTLVRGRGRAGRGCEIVLTGKEEAQNLKKKMSSSGWSSAEGMCKDGPRPSLGPGGTPAGPPICHLAGEPPTPGLGSPPSAGPWGWGGPGCESPFNSSSHCCGLWVSRRSVGWFFQLDVQVPNVGLNRSKPFAPQWEAPGYEFPPAQGSPRLGPGFMTDWPSLSFRFQVGLLSSAQRGESFSQFLCFFLEEAVPCVAVDSLFAGRGEFRILTAQTALCSVGSHLYLAGRWEKPLPMGPQLCAPSSRCSVVPRDAAWAGFPALPGPWALEWEGPANICASPHSRACPTVSSSRMMGSCTWATALAATRGCGCWNWTTASSSLMWPWSTWRTVVAWSASSCTTASRSPARASSGCG